MEEAKIGTTQRPEPIERDGGVTDSTDLLAARREARRKRILENSNNRLTKITGREHDEPPSEDFTVKPPDVIYPDPELERDVFERTEPLLANINPNNEDIFALLNTLSQAQGNGAIPEGGGLGILGGGGANPFGSNSQTTAPVPATRLVRFLRTKIHIALMATVVYLLFATGRQDLIGGNVFILLLGWEMIEVFLLRTYEQKGSMLNILFMLGGISQQYSQMIIKFTQTVSKIMKDVAIFVFFFVLTHLIWSWLVLGIEFRYILGYEQLEQPTL
ncbi:uncharacterized protein LOC129746890 [Uranotaenia lowii]|uniref:uncharacterized protein LOC129746890 n=1 Tax=Uranotaenia lowii TaxID=190385 RepID=UPI002478C214|nr:uncharacterized protein LOC129746890 [Uranotaenia lowii]XP_055596793.1 uncharacterized protein LOC129746890 [Uranotaenia lowii]XP_055596794.1 uncharacterized protein LOC129746890 [Uranotaenia lowii]